jgi:glucose/arabinose dehydrogenase
MPASHGIRTGPADPGGSRAHAGACALATVVALAALAVAGCAPAVPVTPSRGSAAESTAPAQTPTTPSRTPTLPLEPTTIRGFDHPTAIVSPDDGSGRIFVTDEPGVIRVVRDGVLLPTPALDIRSRVGSTNTDEDGLLGLAFPPDFAAKQYAYIYFTDANNTSRFFRIHVSAADPDAFDPSGMQLILSVPQPYANHKGGQLAFGPDGYLYIGLGDGGSERDPGNRGQGLSTLLGKILRIDVESNPTASGYSIPADNPFVSRAGARPEIWAYGLRNPWRFSFDPANGDLWIGDVGQDLWEEIDRVADGTPGGMNFGWSLYEGDHLFKATSKHPGFTWPIAEYSHSEGIAVIGGYVYRGKAYPAMQGLYVFGDYGSGKVWTLRQVNGAWVRSTALSTPYRISTFGTDGDGELWLADWSAGTIVRVGDLSR